MDRGHNGNFAGLEFWPPDISIQNAEARVEARSFIAVLLVGVG